jgi:hypothetical protein
MRRFIGNVSLPVNGAIDPCLRVVMSANGYLTVAGSNQDELGVLEERVLSTDVKAAVIPRKDPSARDMVTDAAIPIYTKVYAQTSGLVTSTANSYPRGTTLSAATAAGSFVTVLPDDTATTS